MKFLILILFSYVFPTSGQNLSVSANVQTPVGYNGYLVNQVIPSGSPQEINNVISTLFPNKDVNDSVRNLILQYTTVTDQPNAPIQSIINAKSNLLDIIPDDLKKNLDDAFSKQRDNMQNYLEDLNSMVTKNNNVYSSTFKQINDGLAAYMGDGEVSSEVTTQTICNQISQLANSLPDVVFLTEKYFDFDPMNPVTPGICQQQLFSLVGTVNIGNGNPSPVGTAQNGIQTITNGVGNTANTVGGKIGDAANTVGEKVGNAVNTAGENLGNLAGNIQGGISSALNG